MLFVDCYGKLKDTNIYTNFAKRPVVLHAHELQMTSVQTILKKTLQENIRLWHRYSTKVRNLHEKSDVPTCLKVELILGTNELNKQFFVISMLHSKIICIILLYWTLKFYFCAVRRQKFLFLC